jgi:GNAT superfamily N-acetyltransferase
MSSDLVLRPATMADAPALAQLGRESFVSKFGHLYRPEDLAMLIEQSHSEPAARTALAREDYRCQLAEVDGQLAGYCRLVLACGWPEHARGQSVIELKQLYTDPARTGQGIGAVLMDWALAEAHDQGADEVQLSVYSENPGAQKFYARYGFAKVADTVFMVGDQADHEFLFAKLL